MENKVPTPNFSSENSEVEYFKNAPVSKWDFESFKKHRLTPKQAVIYTKYKHCLHMLARFNDISEDKMQIVNGLINNCPEQETLSPQKQPRQQRPPETNYYNYGTVGFQGEINGGTFPVIPSKRVLEETEDGHVEIPRPDRKGSESPQSLSLSEQEHTSPLTDTTDESFKVTEPSSNYGELHIQRQYILELNEFDDISLTSRLSPRNMDYELSLDERLLLSSISYYKNCPDEILLKPYAFSDQTYNEIRNWRRSKLTRTEYFPSQFTPEDPPTAENVFQRNLRAFLVNLTETLDRSPVVFEGCSYTSLNTIPINLSYNEL